MLFRCLFHADEHPSAQLWPDASFYCYACGARGSLADLVAKGKQYRMSAKESLQLALSLSDEVEQILAPESERDAHSHHYGAIRAYYASLPAPDQYGPVAAYLRQRRIWQTAREWGVKEEEGGAFPVVFPLWLAGSRNLVGVCKRSLDPSSGKAARYRYSRYAPLGRSLVGLVRRPGRLLVVTEGLIDMLTALSYGCSNAIALLFPALSRSRAVLLDELVQQHKIKGVLVATDADHVGERIWREFVDAGRTGLLSVPILRCSPAPYKDLNEIPDEQEFRRILSLVRYP